MSSMDDIRQARSDKAKAVVDAFLKTAQTAKATVTAKTAEAASLRAQAKALEQEAEDAVRAVAVDVDRLATTMRFPALEVNSDKEYAPWLKAASPDQLMLAIGDDEWIVCSAPDYEVHHYGQPDDAGNRGCMTPGHRHKPARIASYNLGFFGGIPTRDISSVAEVTADDPRKQD